MVTAELKLSPGNTTGGSIDGLSPSSLNAPVALVTMAALEIYNENIRDLGFDGHGVGSSGAGTGGSGSIAAKSGSAEGQPGAGVSIRVTPTGEVVPVGASWTAVSDMEDAQRFFDVASARRATADNGVNSVSSRSHLVVLVRLAVAAPRNSSGSQPLALTRGKLVLVDLAGSERLSATGLDQQAVGGSLGSGMGGLSAAAIAAGERLKEAQSINKSLSALGNVVAALATQDQRTKEASRKRAAKAQAATGEQQAGAVPSTAGTMHIPYRDSVVTRLLQDCLGGAASTTLVIAVSPDGEDASETLCSLQFGQRARAIRSDGGSAAAAKRGARSVAASGAGAGAMSSGPGGVFSPGAQRVTSRLKAQLAQAKEEHAQGTKALRQQVDELRKQLLEIRRGAGSGTSMTGSTSTLSSEGAARRQNRQNFLTVDTTRDSIASAMDFKVLPAALQGVTTHAVSGESISANDSALPARSMAISGAGSASVG